LNPWTIEIALAVIANITAAGTTVSSRIKTVGGCSGIPQNTRAIDFVPFVDPATANPGDGDGNSDNSSAAALSVFCCLLASLVSFLLV
jgi:hypothetical protein